MSHNYLLKIVFHGICNGDRQSIGMWHESVIDKRVSFRIIVTVIHAATTDVTDAQSAVYYVTTQQQNGQLNIRNFDTCLSLYCFYSPGRHRQKFQGEVFFCFSNPIRRSEAKQGDFFTQVPL